MKIFDLPVLLEKEIYEYMYLVRRLQYLTSNHYEEHSDYACAGYIRQTLKDSDTIDKLIINLRILKKCSVPLPNNIDEYEYKSDGTEEDEYFFSKLKKFQSTYNFESTND